MPALERSDASCVSDSVLEALSSALQLDDAERAHLFDLVRAQHPVARRRRRRTAAPTIRPSVQRLLDLIDAPAYSRNGRMDILATNRLGEVLYSEILSNPRRPANTARFCFLDPRATTFYIDWDESADVSVAVLRAEAGRNPHDQELTNLIGEPVDAKRRLPRLLGTTRRRHLRRRAQAPPPSAVCRLELTYEGVVCVSSPWARIGASLRNPHTVQ